MTEQDQKQLGKTLWNIADQLRGAMNADDFRDYMEAVPSQRGSSRSRNMQLRLPVSNVARTPM